MCWKRGLSMLFEGDLVSSVFRITLSGAPVDPTSVFMYYWTQGKENTPTRFPDEDIIRIEQGAYSASFRIPQYDGDSEQFTVHGQWSGIGANSKTDLFELVAYKKPVEVTE